MGEEAKRRQLINGNRVGLFGANTNRVIAFICECGAANCHETVLLTAAEYRAMADEADLVLHRKHASMAPSVSVRRQ